MAKLVAMHDEDPVLWSAFDALRSSPSETVRSAWRWRTMNVATRSFSMALNSRDNLGNTGSDFELRDDDRFAGYEAGRERSHLGAFLMGGVVVAGGLLAFLYYDTDNLNERPINDLTTGSISRSDAPPTLPSLRLSPSNPDATDKP
jgi:hypothetical protein